MRRIAVSICLLGLLGACTGEINERIIEVSRDKTPYNTVPALVGIMSATPPINTIFISPCKDELFPDKSRRDLCELNHKIRGTSSPWERNAAEARLMTYQPGELQCSKTLGGVPDCRVIGGTPRPVNFIAAPNMGAN